MAKAKLFPEVGRRFGRLVVLSETVRNGARRVTPCVCDCGTEKSVPVGHLYRGAITSCGCAKKERASKLRDINTTHGATRGSNRTPTYLSWASMRLRCNNPNATGYERYGGVGITICPRWDGPDGFPNFLSDMGVRPDGFSLDRIDNQKGYSPENCRWADMATQKRNRKNSVLITHDGQTKSAAEWARLLGTHRNNILRRLKRGLPLDQVLRP